MGAVEIPGRISLTVSREVARYLLIEVRVLDESEWK